MEALLTTFGVCGITAHMLNYNNNSKNNNPFFIYRNIQLIQNVRRAYILCNIMYTTIIHDDIVYSIKILVLSFI